MTFQGRIAALNLRATAVLVALCLAGWLAIIWSASHMASPAIQFMMPVAPQWTAAQSLMVLLMWAVMMGAMMLPSALPMILAHQRFRGEPGRHFAFVSAYFLMWLGFSLLASAAQWSLQAQGLLTRMLVLNNGVLAGIVLIAIGLFQFSGLKNACLSICRTPMGFLMNDWRPGKRGAFVMGLRHGLYCIGCCWALMAALFVFGVMNIYAIAIVATLVAVEKLSARGRIVAQIIGFACILGGIWQLF